MEKLDIRLLGCVLFEALREQCRGALTDDDPRRLPSVMLVCREWRDAIVDDPRSLARTLLIQGPRKALKKAFEKACGVFMREVVQAIDADCWVGPSAILEDALASRGASQGASLDVDVVREFLKLGRWESWRNNKLPRAIATAVELGRIDLAQMIAARLAEIDKADYEDEADNVDEAVGTVDASRFKSIVYASHVIDALCEAPSVAAFRTLRSVVFPDAPYYLDAVFEYAASAMDRGVMDIVSLLLSEIDEPEFHGRCLTHGARCNLAAAVAAAMRLAPAAVVREALVCAAKKGRYTVVRVLVSSGAVDAATRAEALDDASGRATVDALLADCDVDRRGSTLVAAADKGYCRAAVILLSRKVSKINLARKVAIDRLHVPIVNLIDRALDRNKNRFRQPR